ncbi:MAG TPA: lytic transglycosylase domain-containing protein [Anaeromyxobacteraceae bacterium]|nr:lytic transglycosylase domain-containing protein [Anaeromyxobacteraceae bacterium]
MRAPRARGPWVALLALAAAGATVAAPWPLRDGVRPLPAAEREPRACAAGRACFDSSPEAWVDRVEARIAMRAPAIPDAERARLAEVIVEEALAARIDPILVLALIEVESRFDPAARSGSDARGLMQLLPATMRSEAERSGIAFEDLHDPVANVQAGVRYLRRLIDAFGQGEVALMAYNAGPNRILAFLREGEIPARFHVYPRRVRAEERRLRRHLGIEPVPAVAEVLPARRPVQ